MEAHEFCFVLVVAMTVSDQSLQIPPPDHDCTGLHELVPTKVCMSLEVGSTSSQDPVYFQN